LEGQDGVAISVTQTKTDNGKVEALSGFWESVEPICAIGIKAGRSTEFFEYSGVKQGSWTTGPDQKGLSNIQFFKCKDVASLKLIKVVINNDGGTASANDWTLEADGPSDLEGTTGVSATVLAGAYSLSEDGPDGYSLASIACVGGADDGSDGTVDLGVGETVTCTFTNDDVGSDKSTLTLVKEVMNDDGGVAAAADWTLKADGPTTIEGVSGTPSVTSVIVDPGDYDLTEDGPTGYSLTSIACTGNDSDGSDGLTLASGEDVICTYTNDDQAATLTLVKQVVNNDGGTASANDWTLKADGPSDLEGTTGVSTTVLAGTYDLTEDGPDGYSLASIACVGGADDGSDGTVDLGVGETVTCTFTNDDVGSDKSTLTLVKEVMNDDGGVAAAADWTLKADGPTTIEGVSGTPSVTSVIVDPGDYDLTEDGPTGYSLTSIACTGNDSDGSDGLTLASGEDVICTYTNDDQAATLTLVKQVVNNDGGTASANDWTLKADGPSDLEGTTGVSTTVLAGTYDLTEDGPDGYSLASIACVGGADDGSDGTVDLGVGETVTCTFTNDDTAATLTLVKQVVTDDGGTASPSDWTLTASGPTTVSGASGTGGATLVSVPAGDYDLTEDGPTGYSLTSIACTGNDSDGSDGLTLEPGEDVTCTYTNDDQAATLTLVKEVVNNDGGTASAGDWTLTASGPTTVSGASGTGAVTLASVPAGDYDLTEDGPTGYSQTSIACTGNDSDGSDGLKLAPGENVTCTYTNDDIPRGSLRLIKNAVGGSDEFTFELSQNSALLERLKLKASGTQGGTKEIDSLIPGIYTVSEVKIPDGWDISGASCENEISSSGNAVTFQIVSGETTVCTFVNFKEEDEEMEDITKLFIYRRVDNLLSHDPDRARLLRRLQEQQPVSLKDTALPPLKMTGSMDGESGQVQFSTSLSQMRASMMAQDAAKIRKAQTGDGMKSSFADDPYIAPYMMTRPGWDIWIEGQISRYDDTTAGIERDGIFKILYVGADYAIAPGVIVGALVQVDRTDESVDDPDIWGEIEGTGWMVGPYMGAKISDNLMFDARAAWGQSDNDIQLESEDGGFRTGEFETDRWLVTAKLTGLWYHGGWRISPHVGLAWGNEDQDAYINSIGQTIGANSITIGRVTFGPEFGYKHMMLDGSVIEPHIAIEGIWNFDGDDLVIGGTPVDTDEFRAKVEGGVIFATPDGYKLRAAASYDGLGADDFEAWSAKAWLNIPLDRADDPIQ